MLVELRRLDLVFKHMVGTQLVQNWATWLAEAVVSDVKDIANFAIGLCKDETAVRQALVQPFSNGPVAGQSNHLKLRQMYGRATFDLLKSRVLYRAS